MKSNLSFLVALSLISIPAWGGVEGMPKMPKIQPKKVYSIKNKKEGEELLEQRGYGDQEPMVRMMNLMMVGGSGYEGMDMSEMAGDKKHVAMSGHEGHMQAAAPPVPTPAEGQTASYDFNVKITPDPPKVGTNTLVVGIQHKNEAKPAKGLNIKAQVFMTTMDMGTEEPNVKEIAPGRYQIKVGFSMKGQWAVKLLLPESGEKVLNFEVGTSK